MKKNLVLLSLSLSMALGAAEVVRYDAQPGGGKMKLDGTATTGSWSVECAAIGGFVELDAAFPEGSTKPKVEISVTVRQLKSGKKAMDAVMHDAMKQSSHAKIGYKVLELKPKGAASGGKSEFDATGTLTVAGVTRTNTMPVTIERLDKTKLKITGAISIKMTDFGIKPPSPDIPGGSIIKTGDDVKISFEWMPEVEKP